MSHSAASSAAEYVPAEQLVAATLPAGQNVPARHASHSCAPGDDAKPPAAHSSHTALASAADAMNAVVAASLDALVLRSWGVPVVASAPAADASTDLRTTAGRARLWVGEAAYALHLHHGSQAASQRG